MKKEAKIVGVIAIAAVTINFALRKIIGMKQKRELIETLKTKNAELSLPSIFNRIYLETIESCRKELTDYYKNCLNKWSAPAVGNSLFNLNNFVRDTKKKELLLSILANSILDIEDSRKILVLLDAFNREQNFSEDSEFYEYAQLAEEFVSQSIIEKSNLAESKDLYLGAFKKNVSHELKQKDIAENKLASFESKFEDLFEKIVQKKVDSKVKKNLLRKLGTYLKIKTKKTL
jgi:hypothetical protein